MTEKKSKGLNISAKSFLTSIGVIFGLMVFTYILTFLIPGGRYDRISDEAGNMVLDTAGGFHAMQGGLPFWKWILSPILVLTVEGSGTLLAVIAFLLVIGGVFNALEKCGLMKYMLGRITHKYGKKKYLLLAIVVLFFMAMGSFIGSFEECVPLVPIVVALAVSLGWDAITGLAMSILAAGCGFAAGVCNPFTIGVAQELAGLPMFSGLWLRAVSFICIYGLLVFFIFRHARKIQRPILENAESMAGDPKMDRAMICFVLILGAGILLVFSSGFIKALQDYTMIIVAVMFLVAGIAASLISGMSGRNLAKEFGNGVVSILPAVLMILMASSIKYTLEQANILDTILHGSVEMAGSLPQWAVILFIYVLVLVMNFFIASGSAKAFLLIPLIVPMAQVFNVSSQLCIMAFAFGDGFSNVFYPTNPVLLISLGVAGESYGRWVKWSWKFQLANVALTSLLLLFGLAIGY